jgi:hypothetical protein
MFSNLTVSGNRKAALTGNPTPQIAFQRAIRRRPHGSCVTTTGR